MQKPTTLLRAAAALLAASGAQAGNPPANHQGQVRMPAPAANGSLNWGNARQYYPMGCIHNGNRAVCSFGMVNTGGAATLTAWGGELWGLQMVDDGHVPHGADTAYFLDKFGARQGQLFVNPGDRGAFAVEFPNVDSRARSAEFHLQSQVVGQVAINQPMMAPGNAFAGNGGMQGVGGNGYAATSQPQYPQQQQPYGEDQQSGYAAQGARGAYAQQPAQPQFPQQQQVPQQNTYQQVAYPEQPAYAQQQGYPQQQQQCATAGSQSERTMCRAQNGANTVGNVATQAAGALQQLGGLFHH